MIVFVILFIILLIVGVIVINTTINNAKYRAQQHVLGKVGLGSSDINAAINARQEQTALTNLINTYPNLTEKQVKDTLYGYSNSIIRRENNGFMNEKVISKMNKDKKLEKMLNMNFVRINILGFKNNTISSVTVYTDGKDEYQIIMTISINNNFYIENYNSMRGSVKGF